MIKFLEFTPITQQDVDDWISYVNDMFSPIYRPEEPKIEVIKTPVQESPKNIPRIISLSTPIEVATPARKKQGINNTASYVVNYFMDKGLTETQARGILGNIIAESGLNPAAVNEQEKTAGYKGYGKGLVQWSNERVRNFEDSVGVPIEKATLQQQLDYMWKEMNERTKFMQALKDSTTLDEATDAVYRGYLNGSKTALAPVSIMQNTYSKAWEKLGLKKYDFYNELKTRIKHGNKTISA